MWDEYDRSDNWQDIFDDPYSGYGPMDNDFYEDRDDKPDDYLDGPDEAED